MNKSRFFNNTAELAEFVFNKDIFSLSQQIQENQRNVKCNKKTNVTLVNMLHLFSFFGFSAVLYITSTVTVIKHSYYEM